MKTLTARVDDVASRMDQIEERMAANGQVLVPTLSTFHDLAERFADQWVPRLVEQAQRQLEEAYLTLEAAHAAGVTVAMGFDSGPPGSEPWELVRMAEGGLGSLAALAVDVQLPLRVVGDQRHVRLDQPVEPFPGNQCPGRDHDAACGQQPRRLVLEQDLHVDTGCRRRLPRQCSHIDVARVE